MSKRKERQTLNSLLGVLKKEPQERREKEGSGGRKAGGVLFYPGNWGSTTT